MIDLDKGFTVAFSGIITIRYSGQTYTDNIVAEKPVWQIVTDVLSSFGSSMMARSLLNVCLENLPFVILNWNRPNPRELTIAIDSKY
jgi:hypothetical protein